MNDELRAITKNQRNLDKACDDVFGNAVGEIILLRIAAHVGEGKDGNRGPIRQRQCEPWLFRRNTCRRDLGLLLFAHRAHKPDALAQNGADQPLIFTIVADGSSGRIDAARQR
jgi:hypothetical protein